MKCVSRSRMALIAAVLFAACAQETKKNTIVSAEMYKTRACWINHAGNLDAFLVLAEEGGIAVPYLISTKCEVSDNYSSYGEGVLHNLNAVRLVDMNKRLHNMLPQLEISDSTVSDQPKPSSHSKMYFFEARVNRIQDNYMVIYTPTKIHNLTDLNIPFASFLGLTAGKRQNIYAKMMDNKY